MQRVINRLERDGADLVAHDLGDAIRRDVRLASDGAQHGEALRGDLNAAVAKEAGVVRGHREIG